MSLVAFTWENSLVVTLYRAMLTLLILAKWLSMTCDMKVTYRD